MEKQERRKTSGIIEELLEHPRRFSFIQAVRLILREFRVDHTNSDLDLQDLSKKILRIRPELSLDFPATDVVDIQTPLKDEELPYLITATFLGLYGSSSPLPTFYTEDLLYEKEDDITITRDFIDIINNSLFQLFIDGYSKNRLAYKVAEVKDPVYLNRLYSISGFFTEHLKKKIKDPYKMLKYAGILIQFPRSAESLRALLSDIMEEPSLEIEECVYRKVNIPLNQLCRLGESCTTLDEDLCIGEEVDDISGKFRIHINAIDFEDFHKKLPDENQFNEMKEITNYYLDRPLDWDVCLKIKKEDVRGVQLGQEKWGQLGWSTWLADSHGLQEDARVLLES